MESHSVRRGLGCALLAAWTAGAGLAAYADGNPRSTDGPAFRHSLRAHSDVTGTGQLRRNSRLRRAPVSRDSKAIHSAHSVDRTYRTLGIHRNAASTQNGVERAPAESRRNAYPNGLRVLDLSYAPETLNGAIASAESSQHAESRAHRARTTSESSASRVETQLSHAPQELETRYYGTELRRQYVPADLRDAAATRSASDMPVTNQTGNMPGVAGYRESAAAATVNDTKVSAKTESTYLPLRSDDSANVLRHDSLADSSQLRSAPRATNVERETTVFSARAGIAARDAAKLKAAARINASASTADTVVVFTVENVGQETVRAPVIRVALPEGVEYKGIAYGPPGTAVSVTQVDAGSSVDVVVPMRLTSGQSRRVMLYLAPRHTLNVEGLTIKAFPQGADRTPAATQTDSNPAAHGASAGAGRGEFKDP